MNKAATAVCAVLLIVYGVLSYCSTLGKNAAIDEPTHAVEAYLCRWYEDYRIDASNPPLWMRWVALGMPRSILKVDFTTPVWPVLLHGFEHSPLWYMPVLYGTPGNDPDQFIDHARRMTIFVSIALGALTIWWAWRLAGRFAAIVAAVCFAFDPNLLGHGALVKNDIAIALCWTALCTAVWKLGQRVTFLRATAVTCLCAAAVTTKFTGLLAGPLLVGLLLVRALMPQVWPVFGRAAKTVGSKLAIVAAVCFAAALVSWGIIWVCYAFKFGPTADPSQRFDIPALVADAVRSEMLGRDPQHAPTPSELAAQSGDLIVRLAMWADEKHLFPEPFLAGLIYLDGWNQSRPAFLMGERTTTGWWYYFPLAGFFKTPIASLMATILAAGFLLGYRFRWISLPPVDQPIDRWAACCLVLPLVLFGIVAMLSRQNVGIRHVFSMAPPIFILIGIAAARSLHHWRRTTIVISTVLALGLVIESTAAYPDYQSFFNQAVGGERGGLRLLADSNLDWGQDLKGLAVWRKEHPQGQLDLDYLGTADPKYYLGKDYVPLQNAIMTDPQWAWRPGYLAVSATHLQGLYVPLEIARFYHRLSQLPPTAVIGGSIYVYPLQSLHSIMSE
jgi:4-amino-4-deoxy-L-arabinose transferase-like glycosyltransferase